MKSAFAILVLASLALASLSLAAAEPAGTRAGEIGWQYDAFSQNLQVNVTPESPTTSDQLIVTITSKIPEVFIKQATIYGVVYPKDNVQFPFSFPFLKKSDIVFQCMLEPFPLNGYEIEFYIVAYDYFFAPMDSRNSMDFQYDVVGSGWKADGFAGNLRLDYLPLRANASEEVVITITSIQNVTIAGANLYVTFVTAEGETKEGGWNFTKANVNSTVMTQKIPGYPAGTNVTFWVTAWDQYNAVMTSGMYNYSVMGISEYTDFPFEYTDASGDKSAWVPDDAILLPMAGMAALAIPLFIYLYALDVKRKRRAKKFVKADAQPETAPECAEPGGGA
jgi:hypothetical protein